MELHPFEVGLVKKAREAMAENNTTPLQLIEQFPDATMIDLAKEVGASALGILLAVYQDAKAARRFRDCARDTLYRELLLEFPAGWGDDGDGSPLCKLSSWSYNVGIVSSLDKGKSVAILRAISLTNPPPIGWRPASKNDPLLLQLFGQYWPETDS